MQNQTLASRIRKTEYQSSQEVTKVLHGKFRNHWRQHPRVNSRPHHLQHGWHNPDTASSGCIAFPPWKSVDRASCRNNYDPIQRLDTLLNSFGTKVHGSAFPTLSLQQNHSIEQSGKHMSLQIFKEGLKLMVANVMSMFAKAKEATGASASFVRKFIMRHISSPLPREVSYIIDVPVISFAKGLGPSFGKLPRELRDQIFADLIASGHPQFMSVSQMMNAEGMALIYRKGVFKIQFDLVPLKQDLTFCKRKDPLPPAKIVDKLQNLSIEISSRGNPSVFDTQRYARDFSCLCRFKYCPLPLGKCTIFVDISPYRVSVLVFAISRALEGLTNFDTVVMRMAFDLDAITWFPKDRRKELIVSARNRCFAKMQENFEPHLGKGDMESDSDGLRVIYRPRKAQRTDAVEERF